MEARKVSRNGGTREEVEAAMRTLAETIRDAGDCMLDLELALQLLRMANEPELSLAVHQETATCLRRAMRRSRR